MSFLSKKTIDDIDVKGKRVLVRVDFNVPMKDGVITNDNRIVAALPTIKKLVADGGKVILCSHLGKPKNGPEAKFSLAPCAVRLSELLGQPVVFADDDTVVGENAKAAVAAMNDGDVVLLQNTRFRKEETKNLEPFSMLWVKVIIGSIPAMLIGLPFNDFIEEKFNNSYVVAATLIIYGILFIVSKTIRKISSRKWKNFLSLRYRRF